MPTVEMTNHKAGFVFPFNRRYQGSRHGWPARKSSASGNQSIMKMVFFSIFLSSSSTLLLGATSGDLETREFSLSAMGGLLGCGLCLCVWLPPDLRLIARNAIGNLLSAVAFGPIVTEIVASQMEWKVTPRLLVAVSAMLGISGVAILQSIGPSVLTAMKNNAGHIVMHWFGIQPKQDVQQTLVQPPIQIPSPPVAKPPDAT